jgi:hypothetical protein
MEVLDRVKTDQVMIDKDHRIELPGTVVDRYQLTPDIPIRVVEMSAGILLVPLTDEPMDDELRAELALWQSASAKAWAMFPYDEDDTASSEILADA